MSNNRLDDWKYRALCMVGSDPLPQPDFGGDLPICSEGCPHHDGKRCGLTGFRAGQFCEPALNGMVDMLATTGES